MIPLHVALRAFAAPRLWIALSVVAPLGMLLMSGLMLLELRQDAWDKARQTSTNLLQVIERDIARNIEIIDFSLQGVIDNLKAPGAVEAEPGLRQLILFDRAATAKDIGVMLVLDERGDVIFDAAYSPARKLNNADRDYFRAHWARADLGLHISEPLVSRLTGAPILVLSRRIDKPDGTFGGVVLGTLKLTHFSRLFDRIGLGRDGAINLYHREGARIMRHPSIEADHAINLAGTKNFERFVREGRGSFVASSARDGIERHYAFTRVGDLPLVLNVALATDEIEAGWRARALVIGAVVLVLCVLTIGLALLFGRELRRRAAVQAELARLSLTDALTGLANRRRFEEAFGRAWETARVTCGPLSLLIVDADHFKRLNDRYGHQVGDEVLKGLADCLSKSLRWPGDLVCRIGGEEFALLLPETDGAGAFRVAERVHAAVAAMMLDGLELGAGSVTVSIGLASADAAEGSKESLYRRADAALYAAKAAGRNGTRCAKLGATQEGGRRLTNLRLVGAV